MMQLSAAPIGRRGFTVIELMVTLAILAIMMGLGVPSFRAFINSQRVKSATSELMTTLVIARSEAIKRNTAVAITPTDAANWAKGWAAAAGATTLHTQAEVQNITTTTFTDSVCATAGSVATISYANTGRPATASCFKFEAASSSTIRCVSVDLTGIPSSKTWNATLNRCQ